MKNEHRFRKAWWLKYPLLCLLAYPMPSMADENVSAGQELTNIVGNTTNTNFDVQQNKRTRTLVGTIVDDADGTPIIGASIKIKDTTSGVVSDVNGHFSLSIPAGESMTIEISYIGYKTQSFYVTDQGELNVRMVSDNEMLSEVVVVGAGTQKKISVTRCHHFGRRLCITCSQFFSDQQHCR